MILINDELLPAPIRFPGGELGVNVKNWEGALHINLAALPRNSDELIELFMVVNALREQAAYNPKLVIELELLYLPYARQDRVCNPGESHSLKVIAQLINSLKVDAVAVLDPHSDAAIAAIDRCVSVPQWESARGFLEDLVRKEHYELVCPDAGAEKKVNRLAKELGAWGLTPPVYYASKVRNLATGQIVSTKFDDDVTGKNLIIVDDICDGGRTFIELAKKLKEKGAERVVLYVTHGIFSTGMQELQQHIDHVYAMHSFKEPCSTYLTLGFDFHRQGTI